MAYIVPSELPQTCSECPFCNCKFSYPFWATDRGDDCGKQGFYCILDTHNPRRIMVVDFGDKMKKMEWCPLKEVVLCKDCGLNRCEPCLDEPDDGYCHHGERRSDGTESQA